MQILFPYGKLFFKCFQLNSTVVGTYAVLISDNGYGSRITLLFPQSADDMKTSGDYNQYDRRGIGRMVQLQINTDLIKSFYPVV